MGFLADRLENKRSDEEESIDLDLRLGNPNFSLNRQPDSQAQLPAATAHNYLRQNESRAGAAMADLAGPYLDDPRVQVLQEGAKQGFWEDALTFGEEALNRVIGPWQAITTGFLDIATGEAPEGKRDPNLWDYAQIATGFKDFEDIQDEFGIYPSGSSVLSVFGWDVPDNPWARIGRGLAHFAVEVAMDPWTWVGLGPVGVGRQAITSGLKLFSKNSADDVLRFIAKHGDEGADVLHAAARQDDVLTPYKKTLVYEYDEIVDDFTNSFRDDLARLGQEAPEFDVAANTPRMALEKRLYEDVVSPGAQKDWANIHPEAVKELVAYLRGGARIQAPNLPFLPIRYLEKAIDIPGTRGLGRKIRQNTWDVVHNELKRFDEYKALSDFLADARKRADWDRPLYDMLFEGDISPWQWHMAQQGMDSLYDRGAAQLKTAALGEAARDTLEMADSLGFGDEAILESLNRRLDSIGFMEQNLADLEDPVAAVRRARGGAEFGDQLDNRLDELAVELRTMYDDYHARMTALDPEFAKNYLENYTPHIPTEGGRAFINRIVNKGGSLPLEAWMNSDDVGLQIAARFIAAVANTGGSTIDDAMGSVRFIDRSTGRWQARQMAEGGGPIFLSDNTLSDILQDTGSMQLFDRHNLVTGEAVQTAYMSSREINDAMGPALKRIAEDLNIRPPRSWDGNVLQTNPFEAAREYAVSMEDAIQAWNVTNALKAGGLILSKDKALDLQSTIQNLVRHVRTSMDELAAGSAKPIQGASTLDRLTPKTQTMLKSIGLSDDQVDELAQLVDTISLSTRQEFRTIGLGTVTDNESLEVVAGDMLSPSVSRNTNRLPNNAGMVEVVSDGTRKHLFIQLAPDANYVETMAAQDEINKILDRLFRTGELDMTSSGIESLFNSGSMTNQTSDYLYDYLRTKFRTMDPDTIEFLMSGEPFEFMSAKWYYQDWVDGVNDFINSYTPVQGTAGQLEGSGRLLGGQQQIEELENLAEIGRILKNEHDYDVVANIMDEVPAFTNVKNLKGYIYPEQLGLSGKALDNVQIERNAGLFLRNIARNSAVLNTPGGIAAAKIATKQFLTGWRGLVTLARPTFHTRNTIGIAWMNAIMGVKANTYLRFNRNIHKFRKGLLDVIDDDGGLRSFDDLLDHALNQVEEAERAAFRAMWDEGVLSGYVDTEFRSSLNSLSTNSKLDNIKVFDPDKFFLTRWGAGVMQNVEDYGRGTLFLEYFDQNINGSQKVARDLVNAVHFDYNMLTPWETIAKSWVPFFVWTRRNIPRQLSMMAENPGVIAKYQHMLNAMNDNFGGRDEFGFPVGDHFSAQAAGTDYLVNPNTPYWARIMIDPDLPVRDLTEIPNPFDIDQLVDFANGMLGPHVTTLFELNAQREFNPVNAPAPLNGVLRGLAALGFYDKTTSGDVRIPYLARTLFETLAPFARETIDPITGGPSDPSRRARLGITEEDDWWEATLKSFGMTAARGVGIKTSTPYDARNVGARTQNELQKLIQELRLQGILNPQD